MGKTLIYYLPEYRDIAKELQDNYVSHGHGVVDVISEEEQDDIEYAREKQYDEAIFVEDRGTVIIHEIKSGYMRTCAIADVWY